MKTVEDAYQKYCETRFPLPTEEQVAALEGRIGISLPDDYRRFVLTFNGGFFNEPDIVPPSEECPLDCLNQLDGIGATHPVAELATATNLALFDDNDPPVVVPIGYTLMGNLILLLTDPDPEIRGSIMLKRAFSDQYFFLASGIEDFFGLLREPTDDSSALTQ